MFTGPALWNPKAPRPGVDISEGQAWARIETAFSPLLPAAEEAGVFLCVESVFGHTVRDYYTTRELFTRCPSPVLAINMDPSHYALVRNDIPWAVRQWGKAIKHAHLKDAAGWACVHQQDFIFPLLGEGLVDWSAFVAALDDVGYDGFLTVELESFPGQDRHLLPHGAEERPFSGSSHLHGADSSADGRMIAGSSWKVGSKSSVACCAELLG